MNILMVDHSKVFRAACPDRMRTPSRAISGIEDNNRRIELFRLGINDFISKPVLDEEVQAGVTHLITNRQLIERVLSSDC